MAYIGNLPVNITTNDLTDVNSGSPADNHVLVYDSGISRFVSQLLTTTQLPTTGVVAGTYGSASQVPVFTVTANGLIDSAGTVSVAGVSNFTYDSATGQLVINTADGGTYAASVVLAPFSTSDLSEGTNLYYTTARADSDARHAVSASGDLSYDPNTGVFSFDVESVYTQANFDSDFNTSLDAAAIDGTGLTYNSGTNTLSITDTGVVAGTYGSASQVPVFTVNAQGQIDSASTVSVAGVSAFAYDSATGQLTINTADGGTYAATVVLDPFSTTNLSEGSNLYYTTARADSAFDDRLTTKTTTDLTEGTNLYYTTSRADSAFDDRLATKTTADLSEGTNLYYTTARADSAFDDRLATKTTTDLSEGTNLYYTTARADSAFDVRLTTKTTTDLTEGTNLYYTTSRADSAFDVRLATKTTTDLTEGTNLYYTTARADSDAKNAISVTDAGGDGSLTYSAATGVITYTGPSATEVRAHFTEGQAINITAGKIGIDSSATLIVNQLQTTDGLIVGGNLQVDGTTTTVNTQNLDVTDNMIYINSGESSGSPTLFVDVGWAANVNDNGSYEHVGMFRDATDDTFKIFEGYTPEPDAASEINTGHASFSLAKFQARTLTGKYLGADSDIDARLTGGTGITYSSGTISTNDAQIVHDNLSGFVANEHIDHSSVSITAGSGLTGGGDITTTRTLNIGQGTGITVGADAISTNDGQIVHDNLSGFVANEHIDHTSVTITAGAGLTGGGTIAASRTLNIGQGTGITVGADAISTNDGQIVHDNLSGFVANEHIDHTTVTLTAGRGLTGGGDISASRSFAIDSAEFAAYFSTTNLPEGSNLYYTTARADSDAKNALTAGNAITYTPATGTIAVTSNSIQADELDVSGNGTAGQALISDGDGSFSWGAAGATLSDDTSTNASRYILWDDITSGSATSVGVSSTKLTFNPSSGLLYSTEVQTTALKDGSGRTLVIKDSDGTVLWGN